LDQYRGWFQSSLLTAVGAGGPGAVASCASAAGSAPRGAGCGRKRTNTRLSHNIVDLVQ